MKKIDLNKIQSTIILRHGRTYTKNIFVSICPNVAKDVNQINELKQFLFSLQHQISNASDALNIKNDRIATKVKALQMISLQPKKYGFELDDIFIDYNENEPTDIINFEKLNIESILKANPLLDIYLEDLLMTGNFKDENSETLQLSDGGTIFNVFLSGQIFTKYLNLPKDEIPKDQAFRDGMTSKTVNGRLKDTHVQYWGDNYNKENIKIDLLILIADDTKKNIDCKYDEIYSLIEGLASKGITCLEKRVFSEDGKMLNDKKRGIQSMEHFGYKDGIENPSFINRDGQLNIIEAEKIVLVKDHLGSYGSYLVYRKLFQDYALFEKTKKELVNKINKITKFSPKISNPIDYIGVQFFGRHPTGHPLPLSLNPSPESKFNPSFQFESNTNMCPYHAHIRKMNPRKSGIDFPQISRMGIPYGEKHIHYDEVGLLFMCFQKNIRAQFEALQLQAQDLNFPKKNTGFDPIIGMPQNKKSNKGILPKWNLDYDKESSSKFAMNTSNKIVKLLGGEYFYAPSIIFFETLNMEV